MRGQCPKGYQMIRGNCQPAVANQLNRRRPIGGQSDDSVYWGGQCGGFLDCGSGQCCSYGFCVPCGGWGPQPSGGGGRSWRRGGRIRKRRRR